jgi:hypothetical protein
MVGAVGIEIASTIPIVRTLARALPGEGRGLVRWILRNLPML